jgi:Dyp-type peroxidase family
MGSLPASAPTASSGGGDVLELNDIQSGVLHPRPTPYVGRFLLVRIDSPAAGSALVRALLPAISIGLPAANQGQDAWLSVAFTCEGLRALGVPEDSLASFPIPFQQGMAARASILGDVDESDPANWDAPFGTADLHMAIAAIAPDNERLEAAVERAGTALQGIAGITVVMRQEVRQLPTGRTSFGFRDGISYPAIEGTGIPSTNTGEVPLKAGEFVLGYPDETGNPPPMPQPDVLGRNGTYVAIRKLHTKVALWRQYLRSAASSPTDEGLLAAKMVGRWPSGAPLALSPDHDDEALGADNSRNNDFRYADDDKGLKCPAGAHVRRANPRDASIIGVARMHRILRRGTTYGPPLPEGVLDDDGADRGLFGIFIGAHLDRQFEFIKSEWINDGNFIGYPGEQDPMAGRNNGSGVATIPERPIRRRLHNLPSFVVTRGGEYCFMPGLTALRWLADLNP